MKTILMIMRGILKNYLTFVNKIRLIIRKELFGFRECFWSNPIECLTSSYNEHDLLDESLLQMVTI